MSAAERVLAEVEEHISAAESARFNNQADDWWYTTRQKHIVVVEDAKRLVALVRESMPKRVTVPDGVVTLDALPDGSVVLDATDEAWTKQPGGWLHAVRHEELHDADTVIWQSFPAAATILFVPTETERDA